MSFSFAHRTCWETLQEDVTSQLPWEDGQEPAVCEASPTPALFNTGSPFSLSWLWKHMQLLLSPASAVKGASSFSWHLGGFVRVLQVNSFSGAPKGRIVLLNCVCHDIMSYVMAMSSPTRSGSQLQGEADNSIWAWKLFLKSAVPIFLSIYFTFQ